MRIVIATAFGIGACVGLAVAWMVGAYWWTMRTQPPAPDVGVGFDLLYCFKPWWHAAPFVVVFAIAFAIAYRWFK